MTWFNIYDNPPPKDKYVLVCDIETKKVEIAYLTVQPIMLGIEYFTLCEELPFWCCKSGDLIKPTHWKEIDYPVKEGE